jgi:uncharacterized protein YdiU (UPF0061 family)
MPWNIETSYLQLPEEFYHKQTASKFPAPQRVLTNEPLAEMLGLNSKDLDNSVLCGVVKASGSEPFAQAYAGHQYGHFTFLGDGRALVLGEQVTPKGERFDIQLKGSGRTPFSRMGDGKAALGPMLREYLMSEAMHYFGIPTTRSLAVLTTGEPVFRETVLPGAILVRVASSHIRVGTFEFAARLNDISKLRSLANYTIKRHFPHIQGSDNSYLELIRQVSQRQAKLIASWLLVGFVHGVMNTDNVSICGETIDYGPCAFINSYDPSAVFSSIDRHGRYAFSNQPSIGLWNLARFAESLLPLIDSDLGKAKEKAEDALNIFATAFQDAWRTGMGSKLGFTRVDAVELKLMERFLTLLELHRADFNNTFRELSLTDPFQSDFFKKTDVVEWRRDWLTVQSQNTLSSADNHKLMQSVNPAIIPRNHLVEEALQEAQLGNFTLFHRLLKAVRTPFQIDPEDLDLGFPPTKEQAEGYQTFCGT